MDTYTPSFYQHSRAWYRFANPERDMIDEIMVSHSADEGGCAFEFSLRWYNLSGKSCLKVGVFEDALSAFTMEPYATLFRRLATMQGTHPQPDAIVALLLDLGLVDRTDTTPPEGYPSDEENKQIVALRAALDAANRWRNR